MAINRRVFISSPRDLHLHRRQSSSNGSSTRSRSSDMKPRSLDPTMEVEVWPRRRGAQMTRPRSCGVVWSSNIGFPIWTFQKADETRVAG